MTKEQIAKFTGGMNMSIVDAMEKIDRNSNGILFIVDEGGRLTGSVSDGDIRRWLIRTGDLMSTVEHAMKTTPRYLFTQEWAQAEDLMRREKITALPLLDRSRKIKDIILSDLRGGGIPHIRKVGDPCRASRS